MVSSTEIVQHCWAAFVVGSAVWLPGYALTELLPAPLRSRERWAAWPAVGTAYWASALYLLPFSGGTWLAIAGALFLAARRMSVVIGSRSRATGGSSATGAAARRLASTHGIVLLLGCGAYLTPLFAQHVPPGMDASRYMYSARLIARQGGLPATLAPFAPDVPFGAANHGLPAAAAVAVTCGATPASAILATIPLSFIALVLSLYLLLRMVARRTPAAVIAVAATWLARDAQTTITWGGFPCVLALAVAIVASRVLVEVLRRDQFRAALSLGLLAGALPLVHACMAAGWLYIGAPVAALVGLRLSHKRASGVVTAAAGAALALGLITVYALVARPTLDEWAAQWIRLNEFKDRFEGTGAWTILEVWRYLARANGHMLTALLVAAAGILTLRRRVWRLAVIMSAIGLSILTVANARFEWLPGTLLLYPTRLRLFPAAIAALAIAFGWRAISKWAGRDYRLASLAGGVLLAAALTYNVRYYQKTAVRPAIDEDAWQALLWTGSHLDPKAAFMANAYGDAASYLPGVAGIAVTEFHANIADQSRAAEQQARSRPITHAFLSQPKADRPESLVHEQGGTAVFANGSVEIVELQGSCSR